MARATAAGMVLGSAGIIELESRLGREWMGIQGAEGDRSPGGVHAFSDQICRPRGFRAPFARGVWRGLAGWLAGGNLGA